MVIAMLNENHWGAYDFVYLRMDFKNHCNVGYAFVNFATPRGVAEFVEKVAGRRWARFNSEKVHPTMQVCVCDSALAGVQGDVCADSGTRCTDRPISSFQVCLNPLKR